MAFNPFSTFQKNQKFWMAAILMVCMITFVFFGFKGDVGDWLMKGFRGTGPTVVRIASRNYSDFDLRQVRLQRNIVNDYMRACCDITMRNIAKDVQKISDMPVGDKKKEDQRKQAMGQLAAVQLVLRIRLQKPRYFEGGVKLDDVIEFKLWEALADQLHIRLQPEDVDFMLLSEFFSPQYQYIKPQQLFDAEYAAQHRQDLGTGVLRQAIGREFRVRLARLAYLEMRPGYLRPPIPDPLRPTEQRVPVTLAGLWKVYQDKRSEFDVALIPIHVADFTKEIAKLKGAPPEAELEKLFTRYKGNRYDPDSPLPSFETPAKVQAEFIMADPTSPIYRAAVRATMLLQQMMPAAGNPLQSPLITAARVGTFAAVRQKDSQDVLEGMTVGKFDNFGGPSLVAEHFSWPIAAHLAERDPRALASLVGHLTASVGVPALPTAPAWTGFLAVPARYDAGQLQLGLTAESQRRLLPSAKAAAALVSGQPVSAIVATRLAYQYYGPDWGRSLLPLAVIEPELEQKVENRIAERWASRNLMSVKRMLDRSMKPEAVRRVVEDVVPKYNLLHVVTKDFYSKYNIAKAPDCSRCARPTIATTATSTRTRIAASRRNGCSRRAISTSCSSTATRSPRRPSTRCVPGRRTSIRTRCSSCRCRRCSSRACRRSDR